MEHCSHPSSSSMLPVPVVALLCHSGRNHHLAFFLWSCTPVCSPLVFCKHFRVWSCIPDVSMERDVLHVHLLLHHPHLMFFSPFDFYCSHFLMFLDSFIIQMCISQLWFSLAPLKKTIFYLLWCTSSSFIVFFSFHFTAGGNPAIWLQCFPQSGFCWVPTLGAIAAHSWDSSVHSTALCVCCPWSAGSRGSIRPSFCPFDKVLWVPAPAASLLDVLSREAQALDPLLHWGSQHGDIHSFRCAVVHILLLINFLILHNL